MKLLLIMPKFFNYPQLITEELNRMGYEVDFFDDRPSTNAWVKAAIRINKKLIQTYIKRYFDEVMKTVSSKKYDVVFLISGQSLSFSEDMIAHIKEFQPRAKFVLYQWDSQTNFPYIKRVQHFFDKCYSFDRKDTEETPTLNFLPLFYSRVYEELGAKNKKDFKNDFCFIGTAHPKKYKFINMMSEQLKAVYPKQFIYFFFPSPIVYFYRKVMNKELRGAKYSEFHFEPLTGQKMNDVYETSRCVLDSAQAGQFGLTIRVLEALGAKKKLITTNKDIVNYDFYRPENIYVYEGHIDLDNVFFKEEYKEVDKEIYEKYSLRSWLKKIVEG
ncbi:hypothetical protein EUBIFOR_01078 [Holdemanella biformis DSM 3989]|uniref:Eps11J n=2 Tax=Holdemanella biformis TaxID=1735 RepID=B7CA57_9FIRM|nr:hypothetical protein EUBIFOR_01078 [Holdemanella biformis DSM 3989]